MSLIRKILLTFWLALLTNKNASVSCSGKTGSEGVTGFWNLVTNFASSVLKGKGSSDNGPNYGKLFEYERSIQAKYQEMNEFMNTAAAAANQKYFENWKPMKFPEASAFSALFIRDIGCHLDTWMDLTESKKLEGSKVLSQHILWIRRVGANSATSYFIYRPSFLAELDSSSILPHLKYHAEAQESAQKVIEAVQEFPNDQIVFAGLQSGGAIAMLHAWMVVSAVPIVFKNLKEFKGELHQLKIFLFDSDCVLSETYAPNFPIPSWDILRFYSGMTSGISSETCRFESMKPIGLSYAFTPSWTDYLYQGSAKVDRFKFVDYYDKEMAASESKDAYENIDNGESFDDNASVAASEISMSVDGNDHTRGISYDHQSIHSRSGLIRKTSQAPVPVKNIEDLIKPGIILLTQTVNLSKFFFQNLKDIYRNHQPFYLLRNVNGCAAAMQKNLKDSLLGKEKESPVVKKGIKDVDCKVEAYNEKTKVALITCTLISKDLVESSILSFRTHVQNDMDAILTQKNIFVVENEREDLFMTARSTSTSESLSVPQLNSRSRLGPKVITYDEDLYFDDRSVISGFQEKSEQWASCLDDLFEKSSHLNFINPNGNYIQSESASVAAASTQEIPGRSFLSIHLPFSSTIAVCEYSLKTQPKNFYQLYRVSSSMFFSIFSDAIEAYPIPSACLNILEPPSILRKNSGNAETFANILNGYFNSDGTAQINHKNVIVNGLEIQESATNLPANNPYEIFKPALCGKLAECLTQNVLEKSYDCNSHLTLWAGRRHCPEICTHRPVGFGSKPLHLCSRVVNCGDGVYLGFRGCKMIGTERPLIEEFSPYSILSHVSTPAYYSAFHLKHVDGWSSTFKKPFRFAVFLNEDAKSNFIPNSDASIGNTFNIQSSSASVRSGMLPKKVVSKFLMPSPPATRRQSIDENNEYEFEHNYTVGNLKVETAVNDDHETKKQDNVHNEFNDHDDYGVINSDEAANEIETQQYENNENLAQTIIQTNVETQKEQLLGNNFGEAAVELKTTTTSNTDTEQANVFLTTTPTNTATTTTTSTKKNKK